jgi:hypothetical protein
VANVGGPVREIEVMPKRRMPLPEPSEAPPKREREAPRPSPRRRKREKTPA